MRRSDRPAGFSSACYTADRLGTVGIMRTAGVGKTAVWCWQKRFMAKGADGLLRDKTRPPGTPRLGATPRAGSANGPSRSSNGPTPPSFLLLPHRWVVERTLGWLGRCRHLAKDFKATMKALSPGWSSPTPSADMPARPSVKPHAQLRVRFSAFTGAQP
jgi:transposase